MFVTYPDVAYLSGCALVAGSPSPLRGRDRSSLSVTVTHTLTHSFTRVGPQLIIGDRDACTDPLLYAGGTVTGGVWAARAVAGMVPRQCRT